MIKLTITQLGTPKDIQTSKGPAQKNYLKAQEYNDKFLNFWINGTTKNWKVGDVVEVEAVEERSYTSKDGEQRTSLDIKLPKFGGQNNEQIIKNQEKILNDLMYIKLYTKEVLDWKREVAGMPKSKVPGTDIDYPEMSKEMADSITPEELASFDQHNQPRGTASREDTTF